MYDGWDKINIDQYNGYYSCFINSVINYNKYFAKI